MKSKNKFQVSNLFSRYPQLKNCEESLNKALATLINLYENSGKLLAMGNGGSSADAEHLCGELTKGFILKRPLDLEKYKSYNQVEDGLTSKLQEGLPAISLGVAHSLISAFANDVDPDYIFAQQVHVLGNSNDVVFGISTSGNSRNVVHAFKVAKAKGIKSIALTGENPSKLSELADITIQVPGTVTHEVQELHLPVYHALCIELENYFFA